MTLLKSLSAIPRKYLLVLIPILLTACSDSDRFVTVSVGEDHSNIEDPLERWNAYNIKNYQIKQSQSCFCAGPRTWTAIILNGEVADVILEEGDFTEEHHSQALNQARTIEELFALAEAASEHADGYGVSYNEKFGYPQELHIDWVEGMADDEVSWSLDELAKLAK